jgi:hypothetical protein
LAARSTSTTAKISSAARSGVGTPTDPTPNLLPNLLATSPNGSHVFLSLRGRHLLRADPHVSTGSTPGVGVVTVLFGLK